MKIIEIEYNDFIIKLGATYNITKEIEGSCIDKPADSLFKVGTKIILTKICPEEYLTSSYPICEGYDINFPDELFIFELDGLSNSIELVPTSSPEKELREKIANQISGELFAALENTACLGRDALLIGNDETTYTAKMLAMILKQIKTIK